MYFEQFYLGCLAHASYLLASGDEAVVVDPQRDVDLYLKAAHTQGAKIRCIFETHLHADFVSGHRELAARTGAKIYIGARAGAQFPHAPVTEGFELAIGALRIRVLETPGHTPESICLVVVDQEKSDDAGRADRGQFRSGDVGRPDLSREYTPAQFAGMLYDSLHDKLMPLVDDVLVYPAHGAGPLCGWNTRAERSSTIGTERLTVNALQIRAKMSSFLSSPSTFRCVRSISRRTLRSIEREPRPSPIYRKFVVWHRWISIACSGKARLRWMCAQARSLPQATCRDRSILHSRGSLLRGPGRCWD